MAGSRIQYVPVSETEALSGRDFEAQTEAFLNDIYTGMETVGEKADSALALAENSIAVATEASQTASEALANAGTAQRPAELTLSDAQNAQTEAGGASGITQ